MAIPSVCYNCYIHADATWTDTNKWAEQETSQILALKCHHCFFPGHGKCVSYRQDVFHVAFVLFQFDNMWHNLCTENKKRKSLVTNADSEELTCGVSRQKNKKCTCSTEIKLGILDLF